MDNIIFDQIRKDIHENDVVLYLKGTKVFPQCGFSAAVVQILMEMGADFKDVNVLEDNILREAIKEFTQWPTIPQLYVKGEFIGGCDIVREMYEAGELKDLMQEKDIPLSSAA